MTSEQMQGRIDRAVEYADVAINEANMIKQISIPSEHIWKVFDERAKMAEDFKRMLLEESDD